MRTLFARPWRFFLVVAVVVLCFARVFAKLWELHIHDAPRLHQMAQDARTLTRDLPANRGAITDSRGTKLATTHEVWDIGVDAHFELAGEELKHTGDVARILKIDKKIVEDAYVKTYLEKKDVDGNMVPVLDKNGKPKPRTWKKIADGVSEEVVKELDKLKIKSVYATHRFVRDYPQGQLAAHLVGFVNKEGAPAMGIEKVMDRYLTGENGWIESMRDGRRKELVHLRTREVPPTDGKTVELTIDSLIQNICEQELARAKEVLKPISIIAIVTKPETGEIVALANCPTFDLRKFNDPKASPPEYQKNRAITDVYEPGSVFKVIGISAGLNEHFITPNSVFPCASQEEFYNGRRISPMPKDDHPIYDQPAPIWKIVQKSSNRGTVVEVMRFCEKFGEQKFYDYAYNFGFGRRTGLITSVGIPGAESSGILHKPESWDGLTISRMPMGHSVSVTAMQMHYAMATIANDGKLMAPMLVRRVLNPDGSIYFNCGPQERGAPITPETAKTMRELLRAVCTKEGTAKIAEIPGYETAGKTGTTQKIIRVPNGNGGLKSVYSNKNHVASFSGFFPARKPEYVITVIVDDADIPGIAYGGLVAAPIFANIAKDIIKQTGMPPVEPIPDKSANRTRRQ